MKNYKKNYKMCLNGQKVIKEETPQYIKENYISKEKVKDKIEELEEEKKYYYSQYKIEELNDKIQVLEELIEEREEK